MDLSSVLVSLAVDALAALLLAAGLTGLRRWYDAPFLVLWGLGWATSALASVASIFALATITGTSTAPRGLASGLVVAGTLAHAVLQVEGARRLTRPAPPPGAALAAGAAVVAYAAGSVLVTGDALDDPYRAVFRLALPFAALGAAFILSAWRIGSRGRGGGLGYLLLSAAFVAFGLQKVLTGVVSAGFAPSSSVAVLFTNLLAMVVVAFALPLWFLEEERAGLREAEGRERELRERLDRAARLESLGQLAAGVAHDFNNLLTVVGGHAELIAQDSGDPERVESSAEEISRAQGRGARLVAHLLAFARQGPGEPAALDLPDALDHVRGLLDPLIGDHTTLRVRHERRGLTVLMDRERLEQVVVNLAVNARDAMLPGGGTISIVTGVTGKGPAVPPEGRASTRPWAFVRVEDGGHGIPAAIRDRIFDPFFTTKVRGRGTGLGLATVYGIVRQSGGAVEVDSEEGRGATFTVLLPLHAPAADGGTETPAPPGPGAETVGHARPAGPAIAGRRGAAGGS